MRAVRFLMVFLLMLLPVMLSAAPFLVCDPYDQSMQVDGFRVRIDAGAWVDVAVTKDAQGGSYLHYDLSPLNLANGTHAVEVKAFNLWGESQASPFSFSKQALSEPGTIHLSKQ